MGSYLFYDLETSGLNRSFDQILQFAAIRTDLKFNPLETIEFYIRLRPDIIISPQALITHRIPISSCMQGISEYEAARKIHQIFNQPGTISLGYNTLKFDDEFLRFLFHRNLLPPYTHQYANGCSRMDILPFTTIYHLYVPDILHWPKENGKTNLRLENLNHLNQLAPGTAHNALVDVKITLELARRLSKKQDIWNYLGGCFNKNVDAGRVDNLPTLFQSGSYKHRMGLMVNASFGSKQNYQIPVLALGGSRAYKNQSLWLRLDTPELTQTTPESIAEKTWVIRKRFGEADILLPPLARYKEKISSEREEIVKQNIKWLQENSELRKAIIDYHYRFKYPEIPDLDPDAALYQMGFLDKYEQNLCREFHQNDLNGKQKILPRFTNQELNTLAQRLLYRNFNKLESTTRIANYIKRINPTKQELPLVDFRGEPKTTPQQALNEIQSLLKDGQLDQQQKTLLSELESYLWKRFKP